MEDLLKRLVESVRSNPKVRGFDEAATKQAIVLPALQQLGWNVFNVEEVTPEFSVENRRVDYALRINGVCEVFIEVKKAGIDLRNFQEQLLDYSFRQGVGLAILTNGVTWWYYLPKEKGSWEERKFYTIDLIEQSSEDVADKFRALLGKSAHADESAISHARTIYKGRLKRNIITETLPEAWNKIIIERDRFLIDTIIETAERICGYKPETTDVERFLERHEQDLLVIALDPEPRPLVSSSTVQSRTEKSGSERRERMPNPSEISQATLVQDMISFLQSKGGTARKQEVEDAIQSKYRLEFGSDYFMESVSHGVPRWKHNIAWAKEYAKHRGLIKRPSESGRGVWELTSLGRRDK
jgi:hypothetical protein